MMTDQWETEFLTYARDKLTRLLAQVARCVRLLRPEELWQRANAHTNSVGNLVLHLTGNVRQWLLGGLGGRPVHRDRPAEFVPNPALPPEQILAELEAVVREATALLATLNGPALLRRYTIQDYEVSGLTAVFHVVEHFSGHSAQIVHITKTLKDVDLSLYDAQGHRAEGGLP